MTELHFFFQVKVCNKIIKMLLIHQITFDGRETSLNSRKFDNFNRSR